MDTQQQINLMLKRIETLERQVAALERGPVRVSRTIMDIKDIIAAKEKMAERYRHKYCLEVAGGHKWTDDHIRRAYVELTRQIRKLNDQIANM